MKLALASDAWQPQVNGVVRALAATIAEVERRGHSVELIEPSRFRTVPCPTYPEIRLALGCTRSLHRLLDEAQPDAIHIATEGPIGWAARRWCIKRGRRFTTSFHTRFPDYIAARIGVPARWGWAIMRRFHAHSERVFVVTPTLAAELDGLGIGPTHLWPLGVDLGQFNPDSAPDPQVAGLPRPILLNVGRLAVEKNVEAFLDCQVPGTKVIVGGGPTLEQLKARYPQVLFAGPKFGVALASAYAAADVFVFPSRTDTFGLVNVEALACGLPIAAYPVPGPLDIVGREGLGVHGGTEPIGALDEDLANAIARALQADRGAAAAEARNYSWERCTDRFLAGLAIDEAAGSLSRAA